MSGTVKRFPDLAASAAESDTDLLALKQTVANADAEPVKWSLGTTWTWIKAKMSSDITNARSSLKFPAVSNNTFSTIDGSGNAATQTYLQSTFTPTLTFATPGDLSVSYSTQTGTYTQIGNLYHVYINLTCTPTFTTASGTLSIAGLPANSGGQHGLVVVSHNSGWTYPNTGTTLVARVASGTSTINLYGLKTAANAVAMTTTGVVSGVALTLILSGTYRT